MLVVGVLKNKAAGYVQVTLAPGLSLIAMENWTDTEEVIIPYEDGKHVKVRDRFDAYFWWPVDPTFEPCQLSPYKGERNLVHPEVV